MNVLQIMRPPDYITLLNAALGFCALLTAARGELEISVLFILLAAAADGLDGFLARKTGSGPLGPNLDSLADLISFGAAPAFLAFVSSDQSPPAWAAGIIYLCCGALRLARFNISGIDNQRFEGLPIPAAGILLALSILLGRSEISLFLMPLLGLLMASSVPYPKIRDRRAAYLLGPAFIATVYLFWQHSDIFYVAVPSMVIIMIYLVSPVISCLQKGR